MIITIDGYAASGKSRAALELAHALGYELLNTSAMYRATAIALQEHGILSHSGQSPDDVTLTEILSGYHFDMPPQQVWLNGQDYTTQIHETTIAQLASRIATWLPVRRRLIVEQRRIADQRNIVCEGRDQGTEVFPNAPVKFFFSADLEVRAQRRYQQLQQQQQNVDLQEVLRTLAERDLQDERRTHGPLRPADDAVRVDTSCQSPDQVLLFLIRVVRDYEAKLAQSSPL